MRGFKRWWASASPTAKFVVVGLAIGAVVGIYMLRKGSSGTNASTIGTAIPTSDTSGASPGTVPVTNPTPTSPTGHWWQRGYYSGIIKRTQERLNYLLREKRHAEATHNKKWLTNLNEQIAAQRKEIAWAKRQRAKYGGKG